MEPQHERNRQAIEGNGDAAVTAPYMPLYVADYLGDTQHLSTEEHGAYLLLLMAMWRHDGWLPNDEKKLARIARVTPRRWHIVAPNVMELFIITDGRVTHKRLEREHQKVLSISEKRSTSGKLGGEAKALKNKDRGLANASDLPQHIRYQNQIRKEDADDARAKRGLLSEQDRQSLFEAGGQALDPTSVALERDIEPCRWLSAGYDFALDVLPAVREVAGRSRPQRIASWEFFTRAIADRHAARLAPMPEGRVANMRGPPERRSRGTLGHFLEMAHGDHKSTG